MLKYHFAYSLIVLNEVIISHDGRSGLVMWHDWRNCESAWEEEIRGGGNAKIGLHPWKVFTERACPVYSALCCKIQFGYGYPFAVWKRTEH